MVREAEQYKAEDEAQRDRVAAKNSLEAYVFHVKSSLQEERLRDRFLKRTGAKYKTSVRGSPCLAGSTTS